MSPGRVTASVGTGESAITCLAPNLSTTAWVSTVRTPRVAITRASGLAVRSGRITSQCTATPSTAQHTIAAPQETNVPCPSTTWNR